MPLLELDADTAWNNMRSPYARWRRISGGGNSTERIEEPEFQPSFTIPANAKILTMGSCFARSIDRHLAAHGFDIPSYRLMGGTEQINKYNPCSILQEVKWALKLNDYPALDHRLIEVGDDCSIDMYLHHGSPARKDELNWPIEATKHVFAEINGCANFIVSLGCIEVWHDQLTQSYLNEPFNFARFYWDNETLRTTFAERFKFQILSHNETYSIVHELFSLFRQYGAPNCKAIVMVSPDPLAGTFSGDDIRIANTYSKSTLHSVAKQLCHDFDFVDYFPSYESITLSPPGDVYEEDGVHVRDTAAAVNVNRMIERYVS